MLQLFQSIFGAGRSVASAHPEDLIERAIERTLDGTDPRLRALPGYKKRLRAGVIHALDHVVALVDSLPPALELSSATHGAEAEITAYFASVEHLREVLERDATLSEWRRTADGNLAERTVMLLLMTLHERKTLGVALEGDAVRHDVAQTTVNFSKHELIDPSRTEDDTRRLLKRRAFDHLLALALGRIATARTERGELERERDLLRRKCKALAAGRWGFDATEADKPADPRVLQQQLDEIESQLNARGAGPGLLEMHLDVVENVLAHAESHFWSAPRALSVDRMGIKQAKASSQAPEVTLTELHNAAGQSVVVRIVSIESKALPAQRDLLRDAERSLR